VFEGNRAEVTTLEEMIKAMEETVSDDVKPKTVVMDAGIVSDENLKYLTARGYHYIVVNRGKTPFEIDYSDMTVLREDDSTGTKIEAKRYCHGGEAYIVCRSEKKRLKEAGIRGRIEDLLLERLEYYRKGLSVSNRPKRYVKVMEMVGRLKEKYPKAAKLYDIAVKPEKEKSADDPTLLAIDMTWTKRKRYMMMRSATREAMSFEQTVLT
jgi:transposase